MVNHTFSSSAYLARLMLTLPLTDRMEVHLSGVEGGVNGGYAQTEAPWRDLSGLAPEKLYDQSLRRVRSGGFGTSWNGDIRSVSTSSLGRSYSWGDTVGDDAEGGFSPRKVTPAKAKPLLHSSCPRLPSDAALRIAVDADSGQSYFVERSAVCDACPYCDDLCELVGCGGCDERRGQLEEVFGPTKCAQGIDDDRRERSDWGPSGDDDNEKKSRLPSLSARYPRKSTYTLCEVRRRRVTGACWVVCRGAVYDVTNALPDHPGGKASVLRNAGGRDCEEDFLFHSKAARKQWRRYYLGTLVDCAGDHDGERATRSSSDCSIS